MIRLRSATFVLFIMVHGIAGCGESPPTPPPATAKIGPDAIRAALSAAEEYLASQKLAEAETIAVELIKKAPDDWRGHEIHARILMMRSILAQKSGNSDEARIRLAEADEAYSAAVKRSQGQPGLLHSAALVAHKAGRTDAAIELLAEAGRLDPSNPQYPLHEAQLLILQDRLNEAELRLNAVLELKPDEPFAVASLAGIALERGDQERAVELIRAAREVDPRNLPLRINEARILRRIGRAREALELLVPLSEAERAEEAIAQEIAAGFVALGEHAKAAAAWEHSFSRNPNSWRAALGIAEVNLDAGNQLEARAWLKTAETLAPADAKEIREVRERLKSDAAQ